MNLNYPLLSKRFFLKFSKAEIFKMSRNICISGNSLRPSNLAGSVTCRPHEWIQCQFEGFEKSTRPKVKKLAYIISKKTWRPIIDLGLLNCWKCQYRTWLWSAHIEARMNWWQEFFFGSIIHFPGILLKAMEGSHWLNWRTQHSVTVPCCCYVYFQETNMPE